MQERLMSMLSEWATSSDEKRGENFDGYVFGIAQARYVIRRIFRLVDEEAKKTGLDPLEHQTLIQVCGSNEFLTISGLAERLDIVSTVASRLVNQLEAKQLIMRHKASWDKRVTTVEATDRARTLLAEIDNSVHSEVEKFQHSLNDQQRRAALVIFTFYAGMGSAQRFTRILESDSTARG